MKEIAPPKSTTEIFQFFRKSIFVIKCPNLTVKTKMKGKRSNNLFFIFSGIKYKDLCPAEIWIPRYMIVMGLTQVITIWLKIMHLMYLYACDMKDNLCTFTVTVLTVLWNFGWLIAGQYRQQYFNIFMIITCICKKFDRSSTRKIVTTTILHKYSIFGN